jgi:hypothetical protein
VTQLGAQLHRQLIQLRDGFLELLIQLLDAARQGAQGHLGGRQRGGDLARPQACAAFDQLLSLEPLQPFPQRCRRCHHDGVQLIESRGAVRGARILGDLEHADHLHKSVTGPALGMTVA